MSDGPFVDVQVTFKATREDVAKVLGTSPDRLGHEVTELGVAIIARAVGDYIKEQWGVTINAAADDYRRFGTEKKPFPPQPYIR